MCVCVCVYIYIYIYIHVIYIFCILPLDRAVNKRFSAQDAPVQISRSGHVVERKNVGV